MTEEAPERDYVDFEQDEDAPVVPPRRPLPQQHQHQQQHQQHQQNSYEQRRVLSRSRSPPRNYSSASNGPSFNRRPPRQHHQHQQQQQYSRPPYAPPAYLPPVQQPYYDSRSQRSSEVFFFSLKSEVYSIIAQAKCNGSWPARHAVADRILGAATHASRVYLLLSMETCGYFMAAALVDVPRIASISRSNAGGTGEKYTMIPLRLVELADVPFGMVRVPEEYMHDRGTMRDGIELDPEFGYEVLEAMKRLSIRLY